MISGFGDPFFILQCFFFCGEGEVVSIGKPLFSLYLNSKNLYFPLMFSVFYPENISFFFVFVGKYIFFLFTAMEVEGKKIGTERKKDRTKEGTRETNELRKKERDQDRKKDKTN